VILIYTTEDHDWPQCMYERGLATSPGGLEKRFPVFQCSAERPRVFQDEVNVDARNITDIKKFVISFLTNPDFFPKRRTKR
jgi:hypothetical protein